MCHNKVASHIRFEIGQIDKLLESYKGLFQRCKESEPDLVELTALASVLHSFYNGIERIFIVISKKIDKKVPEGKQWHREILMQMAKSMQERDIAISDDLKEKLVPYLAFRHFYRYSYSFFLKWYELEKLVDPIFEVWEEFKTELNIFMDSLTE